MGDALKILKGLGEAAQTVQQGIRLMDEANKLRNSSPELQADFIVKTLNDKDKLGITFVREGTAAVGRMDAKQANNLINVDMALTDAERAKFYSAKVDGMEVDFSRDRTKPDGPINGGMIKIDVKKIQSWDQFSQSFDYFNGKGVAAPAQKTAIITGDADHVRKVLEGQAAPAVRQEVPGGPAPVEPPKKRGPMDILRGLKEKATGGGTPSPAPAPTPAPTQVPAGSEGPQSKVEQPIDVAALTAQLGLKAPAAGAQPDSPTAPTFGGVAKARPGDRGVG